LKSVNLQNLYTLVSLDDVSLFTNVAVDKALQIIINKLHNDNILAERSVLQVEAIMKLLEVCLRTTYFQVEGKFFQKKDGMAMGSSLSPIVSNIFMEHFKKLALDSAPWLRYIDIFVIWPHGLERLQNFLSHFNSLRPSIQFTTKIESKSVIQFLDVLVIRKGTTRATKFTENPPTLADISVQM
jgi:hypothetical protein